MASAKRGQKTPYRGGPDAPAGPAPSGDEGLVGDLVRQFADPLAFYRELVQNALDAGATRIVARLVWSDAGEDAEGDERGVLRVSVGDDGCGMDQRTLEEDLTVLFRSSKENDDATIGKFGIGFVSVLAVSPTLVAVDTCRGSIEGAPPESFTLHLHPDRTYDLYRGSLTERGTTVTLHVPMREDDVASFVERSEKALRRWCRHVRAPTHLVVVAPGEGELREVRIDEPFALDAIAVCSERRGEDLSVLVGLPRDAQALGAFYNRGLLLHETRDHELGPIVFKVMGSRLEHTLSRDDVRRDTHYDEAIALVRASLRSLPREAARAALAACEAYVAGDAASGALLVSIVRALEAAGLPVHEHQLVLPLIEPVSERRTVRADALGPSTLVARASSPLVRAVAAAGHEVLDLRIAGSSQSDLAWLVGWITARTRGIREASARFALVEDVAADEVDVALARRVAALLAELAREPGDVLFVRI